jgi:hypothetical protein
VATEIYLPSTSLGEAPALQTTFGGSAVPQNKIQRLPEQGFRGMVQGGFYRGGRNSLSDLSHVAM